MINQKQNIFLLMCLYVLANTPVALCAAQPIIYVAGDGTGNYNCDGKDDHVQINQALQYAANNPGTTVYLKGPFVYDIKSSCLIGSNTEFTGDSSAKLRLADNVGWTTASVGTPIIGQIGGKGTVVHDIKIHGFEIDGNEGAQSGSGGKDLYRLISFQGSSSASVYNISVYDMNLHDAKGEGFRCTFGRSIYYYNNVGSNLQHTVVMYSCVKSGEIHDNIAYQCSCAGDRLDNCQDIIIANETISPYRGVTTYAKNSKGYALSDTGIQICNAASSPATSNITIRDCNVMSGVNGVWFVGLNDASNVKMYNNVIHDSGYENEAVSRNGGIGINNCGNGITIQNNDITGSYVAGINVNSATSGTHTVTVENNNIMNGKTGYAVKNSVAPNVSLILTHNYMCDNSADFYPSSLINTNPATSQNPKLTTETPSVQPVLPIANFSSNVTGGYAPLTIQFTDLSQDATSRMWNFGDGSNSTQQNPMHTYSEARNYTVELTVSNANGTDSKTSSISVIKKEEISTLLIKDNNRLREASPENIYSNSLFLDVGAMSGVGSRYRDVLSFDLNGFTSATQIKSATLSLFWYYPSSSRLKDTIVEIYRPVDAWNPTYVSWNKKDKGSVWNNPGGDWYDKNGVLQGSTPYATMTLKAGSLPTNSYYELDVTNLVREYASGKYPNTGFLIKARVEGDNYIAFYSTDSVNKSQIPKLKIVYS